MFAVGIAPRPRKPLVRPQESDSARIAARSMAAIAMPTMTQPMWKRGAFTVASYSGDHGVISARQDATRDDPSGIEGREPARRVERSERVSRSGRSSRVWWASGPSRRSSGSSGSRWRPIGALRAHAIDPSGRPRPCSTARWTAGPPVRRSPDEDRSRRARNRPPRLINRPAARIRVCSGKGVPGRAKLPPSRPGRGARLGRSLALPLHNRTPGPGAANHHPHQPGEFP